MNKREEIVTSGRVDHIAALRMGTISDKLLLICCKAV